MSYSRWSNSNWYSFYNNHSGETPETQVLSLWYVYEAKLIDFSYQELKQITNTKDLASYYVADISEEDLTEAMEYIKWFIEDVETDFYEK